jgi:Uma2 family endonuclease
MAADEVDYPGSDGKPMAETDLHRDWMVINIQRLQRFFAGRRVYVSGNLLIYYEEGDPRKSVAPDTFVVKNCKPGRRRIFKVWTERRRPNFVLETTSKKTRREDRGPKKETYAKLQVPEYFLYDPLGDWLKPPLQGFRLKGGEYEPIPPDAAGAIASRELGVRFVLEDGDLAMYDVASGERLLSDAEWAEQENRRAEQERLQADQERQRARQEHQRAEQESRRAEQESRRAEQESRRAEQESRRAEQESRRAVQESRRAEQARQRADQESQRAEQAERRLHEEAATRRALEAELARLRQAAKPTNGGKQRNGK